MGNKTRCPQCNRYGNADLDGFCRACYKKESVAPAQRVFFNEIGKFEQLSARVVAGALLEVGCDKAKDVKPEDRPRVLNIIKRRLPTNRKGHIVRSGSRMEDYSRMFKEDPSAYRIEKRSAGIEHD